MLERQKHILRMPFFEFTFSDVTRRSCVLTETYYGELLFGTAMHPFRLEHTHIALLLECLEEFLETKSLRGVCTEPLQKHGFLLYEESFAVVSFGVYDHQIKLSLDTVRLLVPLFRKYVLVGTLRE